MKWVLSPILLLSIFLFSCQQEVKQTTDEQATFSFDTTDATNDFYDNAPTHALETSHSIEVKGEVRQPVEVKFDELPLRSVIVKETLLKSQSDSFVGAYQYHGYSLYDILNHVEIDKANKEDFGPIIDLYVTVEGQDGEKTVVSWGEIFYPANRHQVLVATHVTPIVPSKTKDMWPLPGKSKLIAGLDLYTHRNIISPESITVHSLRAEYEVKRDMEKLYAPAIDLIDKNGNKIKRVKELEENIPISDYPTTFYGRGRGIHGITNFKGYLVKDMLYKEYPLSPGKIKHGIFTIAASDGYRGAFTYSEIMNRNDQSETILIDKGEGADKGRYRLFQSADFFSDRAIKAVKEIRLELANEEM
jgi:hypothetical protein